jgi:hypothetical protein
MLINGCSHAAGAEIDGDQDSVYNRQHSFGNLLANKLGYTPVNISSSGSANASIARTTLEWINDNYSSDMELFTLISWTESSRMEIPSENETWYEGSNHSADWFSKTSKDFFRINQGWKGGDFYEKRILPEYHRFIVKNLEYLEIQSANHVLQLQYFLKSISVNYLMCNTMHMFSQDNKYLNFYLSLIDKKHYLDLLDTDNAFYWKYKNQGYENPKAKYWHHNEKPHELYADELFNFISKD